MIEIFEYKLYSGYIVNNRKIFAYSMNYNKNDLIKHLNKIKEFHNLKGDIIFSEELDKYFQEILSNKEKLLEFRNKIDLNIYKYKEVYKELLKIKYNELISYSELKNRIRKYSMIQIINALKYNPFIIIIPCHRVIRKNGDIGYYTPLGKKFKKKLIENNL